MQLMSKGDFARHAHVTAGAVSQALRTKLKPAIVGTQINAEHPAAIAYAERGLLRKHQYAAGRKKTGNGSPRRQLAKRDPTDPLDVLKHPPQIPAGPLPAVTPPETVDVIMRQLPSDIRELADRSLNDLVSMFGTAPAMIEYLKAIREMERIHKDRLKNAETEGTLVSRDVISVGVIEPVDTAHKKLLTDGARTLCIRLEAMQNAGRSFRDREAWAQKHIGSFIRGAKQRAERNLKNA